MIDQQEFLEWKKNKDNFVSFDKYKELQDRQTEIVAEKTQEIEVVKSKLAEKTLESIEKQVKLDGIEDKHIRATEQLTIEFKAIKHSDTQTLDRKVAKINELKEDIGWILDTAEEEYDLPELETDFNEYKNGTDGGFTTILQDIEGTNTTQTTSTSHIRQIK